VRFGGAASTTPLKALIRYGLLGIRHGAGRVARGDPGRKNAIPANRIERL